MTEPKSAGKSGARRQVRLMDLQRVEEKCDRLEGLVTALTAEASELRAALATSPFAGMTLQGVMTALSFVHAVTQPGASLDYQIYQRAKHVHRGVEACLTGDESLLQDKDAPRAPVTPGASETKVQLSQSESNAVTSQVEADLASLKPPLVT